ncbi:DNA repair and recombination protein rad54 [Phtheirospermum japonicum]|uniref:DNA repair and recombination protein rad54 n=1 Tax=Phtheirospermum japonicum TaxID=374723 RepID=A0A830CYJ1_9LAMI|nr:DNA repair and recombination protein rad54 [Phtheirospermum japonicum]
MPIVCGREPTATEEEEEKRLGSERSGELSGKDNTSNLHNFHAKVKRAISEEAKKSKILAYITALKKLCNHPKTPNTSDAQTFYCYPGKRCKMTGRAILTLSCF